MNDDKPLLDEMAYLVLLSVEGRIDRQQFERLESLIKTNALARDYYFSLHHVFLGLQGAEQGAVMHTESQQSFDSAVWKALAENEKTAESVEIEMDKGSPAAVKSSVVNKKPYTLNKTSLITAIISIAALIMMITFFPLVSREPVATIADAMNVQWLPSTGQYNTGDTLFRSSESLELASGVIKMKFQCGTLAILEGPASFSCIAGGKLQLHSGKIYVQVPLGAEGFTVQTATSKIIDLGTEFGVNAQKDGSTSLFMYKGKASLITNPNGNQANSVILEKGMACKADNTGNVNTIPFVKTVFVRLFDSKHNYQWHGEDVQYNFNLADVVGGGDGFGTGQLDKGISLSDGAMESDYHGEGLEGTSDYIRVPGSQYVDGVFVPVSSGKPVQISSQGHIFKECPTTTSRFYTVLKNGGIAKRWANVDYPLELNGQVYGTPENPVLQMRSNSGITFDLDAIRNAMSGRQVHAFRSIVGVSSNAEQVSKIETKEVNGKIVDVYTACEGKVGRAEVFVLVDGQLKQTLSLTPDPRTIVNLDIKLTPQDRFLTLVSTQGDNEWTHDWVMFAKPYVVLKPQE